MDENNEITYARMVVEAKLLAFQRLLNPLLAHALECSPEVADAHIQDEFEKCYSLLISRIPESLRPPELPDSMLS